jgi:putative hydrolase
MRDDGLLTAVIGPDRRATFDRIQATMALIEGHAEHVMDAAGVDVLPELDQLRSALDRRRRERSGVWRIVERLLGLELKMRQYEVGKRFCDAVVAEQGIARLNRAWATPEALPSWPELEDPSSWLARVAVEPASDAA